ncbi:hypothetical protein BJP25_16975 [Actinokineospora bangkokensis]|uniref:Uncharacterized protein n=1 Tax=Actinokineospora bangkokensis TaxID=1193682 RepID=A0A1Q9LMD6_9PSEU|nr:hypothetical protein BJP25_16975 [Actinokineospora bangkokensis]
MKEMLDPDGARVLVAAPAEIASALARLDPAHTSHHLGAGEVPLWALRSPHRAPASELVSVHNLLHARENRQALRESALREVAEAAPRLLVAEFSGRVRAADVSFLRACAQRVRAGGRLLRVVVLRHRATPSTGDSEAIAAVRTAGGIVATADLHRWAVERGWDRSRVDELVDRRGDLVTCVGRGGATRELAELVVGGAVVPSLSALLLAGDASALSAVACAVSADRPLALARVARTGGIGVRLAAFVAAHRAHLGPAAADRVLALAERGGVDPSTRSLLAYHLGQALAKGAAPAESLRHFDYASTHVPVQGGAGASRVAASHNGAALAHLRTGNRAGAAAAERAGLAALAGNPDPALVEQRCLLLTNLADVQSRDPATAAQALGTRLESARAAAAARSLAGLTYAVPKLVDALLATGDQPRAEEFAEELLRVHDACPAPRRADELAVVKVCSALAARCLAHGAPVTAASWYAEASRRMRQAAPAAFAAMVRALEATGEPRVDRPLGEIRADLALSAQVRAGLDALAALGARP